MEAENKKLRVIYMLDNPLDKTAWKGMTGFINSQMVKDEIPDYAERVFYICGPPTMVDSLKSCLSEELRLEKEKLKLEHFTGYK